MAGSVMANVEDGCVAGAGGLTGVTGAEVSRFEELQLVAIKPAASVTAATVQPRLLNMIRLPPERMACGFDLESA
jgi:hypothetical protein